MVQKTAEPATSGAGNGTSKRFAAGLLGSVASLWVLCAKQAIRASKMLASNSKIVPRSPMAGPKRLLTSISNKAIQLRHKKSLHSDDKGALDDEDFGDGGLWQKSILMGDKCQPLDFSGVIYYDNDGKRLNELPMRSPRASPLPSYAYKSSAN